ncbi:MAG: hypothetical protein WCY09_04155 [Candidatus Omnitrophota bacterium]
MKSKARLFSSFLLCLLIPVFLGCSTAKEMGKGFIGVSTQVLEQKRNAALSKSFALGYNDCYAKVKDILNEKDKESYIYSEDLKKKMIAFYLTPSDTTPVGIFFTEQTGGNTLIEVSSPSTYAKEEIANRIFSGINVLIKSKITKENPTDVKEKAGN